MTTDLERELASMLREKAEQAPAPQPLAPPTVSRIRRRRVVTIAGSGFSAAAAVVALALGARALIADPAPVPPVKPVPATGSPTPSPLDTPSSVPSPTTTTIPIAPADWPDAIGTAPEPVTNDEQPAPGAPSDQWQFVDCQQPCVQRILQVEDTIRDIGARASVGVWLLTERAIQLVDAGTLLQRHDLPLRPGSVPTAIVAAPDYLFVTAGDQLIRILVDSLEVREIDSFVVRSGRQLLDIAAEDGGLWISYRDGDGSSGVMYTDYAATVHETFSLPGAHSIAKAGAHVWVSGGSVIYHIDAGEVRVVGGISTGGEPAAALVARGRREIWTHLGGLVSQIDARTGRVLARYPVRGEIAVEAGRVWVATEEDRALYRIEPDQRRVDHALSIGEAVTVASGGAGQLWLAVPDRISTFVQVSPGH